MTTWDTPSNLAAMVREAMFYHENILLTPDQWNEVRADYPEPDNPEVKFGPPNADRLLWPAVVLVDETERSTPFKLGFLK